MNALTTNTNLTINGSIFGITVIGDITPAQIMQFAELANTVATLRKQLSVLFDDRMADMIVNRLGTCHAEINSGSMDEKLREEFEALYRMGIVGKNE